MNALKIIDRRLDAIEPDWNEWDLKLSAAAMVHIRELIIAGIEVGAAEGDVLPTIIETPRVAEWIAHYTGLMANRVNETIREKLRETLVEGLDNGEGLRLLTQRVLEAMSGEANRYRAQMIARTESARANEAGRHMQLKELGATRKVWMAADQACEFCAALNGKTIAIEENYFQRGSVFEIEREDGTVGRMKFDYCDVPHPPAHPNCRCVLSYAFEEES